MIVFDVTCRKGHTFEGWFKDGETFQKQAAAGEIACPVCGESRVRKGPVAPRLGGLSKGREPSRPDAASAPPDKKLNEYVAAVRQLKKYVQENSDYVGEKFPEEARKIHYGEAESRSIYGEASSEEASELRDEGIEYRRIPWPAKPDA